MQQNYSWTWADKVSSYRFWGLILVAIYTLFAYKLFSSVNISIFANHSHSLKYLATLFIVFNYSSIVGLLVGWFVVEFGNLRSIIYLILLQIVGIVLSVIIEYMLFNNISLNLWLLSKYFAAALIGIGHSATFLVIFTLLASNNANNRVFGVMYLLLISKEIALPITFSSWFIKFGNFLTIHASATKFIIILTSPLLFALVFLLFIKPIGFNQKPKRVLKPIKPKVQNTTLVLLLNFIPLYYIYFLYKTYGVMAYFSNSNKLLSKRGAFWMALLMPITVPIMVASIYDVLAKLNNHKYITTNKKIVVVLMSIFFIPLLPFAMAKIQKDLNKFIKLDAILNNEGKVNFELKDGTKFEGWIEDVKGGKLLVNWTPSPFNNSKEMALEDEWIAVKDIKL